MSPLPNPFPTVRQSPGQPAREDGGCRRDRWPGWPWVGLSQDGSPLAVGRWQSPASTGEWICKNGAGERWRRFVKMLVEAPGSRTPGPPQCEELLRYRLVPIVLVRTGPVLGRAPVPGRCGSG